MSFTDPNLTDPEGAWDWLAVVLLSAAAGSLALALPRFAQFVGDGRVVLGFSFVAVTGAAIGGRQPHGGRWRY